jgi:hypothetical protein
MRESVKPDIFFLCTVGSATADPVRWFVRIFPVHGNRQVVKLDSSFFSVWLRDTTHLHSSSIVMHMTASKVRSRCTDALGSFRLLSILTDHSVCYPRPCRPWDGLKLSHARYASGFKSRSRRAPPLVFYTSCSVACVLGFWWFPPVELRVYSSMWSEAEALSEYGVVPE